MNQYAHAETFTQREIDAAIDAIHRARPIWRTPLDILTDEGRTVLLLLDGGVIVEGWMRRPFLRATGDRATFWTWDARFCRVSQFLPGVDPVVLAGLVEPMAWAEIPAGWVGETEGEHL